MFVYSIYILFTAAGLLIVSLQSSQQEQSSPAASSSSRKKVRGDRKWEKRKEQGNMCDYNATGQGASRNVTVGQMWPVVLEPLHYRAATVPLFPLLLRQETT